MRDKTSAEVLEYLNAENAYTAAAMAPTTDLRATLYAEMHGDMITARNVLDAVRAGRIDVGPLDAYWHLLLERHAPQLTADIRVLEATALAPMPAFVAAAGAQTAMVERLRAAFTSASTRPWFNELSAGLLLQGFAAVTETSYAPLLDWDRAAIAAGYDLPA